MTHVAPSGWKSTLGNVFMRSEAPVRCAAIHLRVAVEDEDGAIDLESSVKARPISRGIATRKRQSLAMLASKMLGRPTLKARRITL
jgi:hypothetical protein